MEKLSLIDMSSDDDLLPSSTYQCDRDLRCSENNSDHEEVKPVNVINQCDPVPKMSNSPEQKQAKSGKVNLRKSLAWDNAFFTSEGVLNTEELGIVNSSFRKTGACSLSGIPEELRKSSESTSTLDSDSYSLASLEGDLFNLRASIQMTVGRHDNIASVEPTPSCLDTEKGVQVSTEKAKPPIALKKVGMNKQQTDRTSKEAVIGVNGAKKGTDSSKLALKPPRMVSKLTSLSTHSKDSSAGLQMKISTKRTSAVGSMSKTNGDSGNKTPRSIGLSKPNPSVKSLISTSTSSSITSPRENSRKRLATRNTDNSLSKQTAKTPTRTSKSRLGSSNHTTKLPPKSSPSSSSTDSFASEVSSSSASVSSIKPSNSVESFTSSNSSPSVVSNKHVSPNNAQRRVPNVKTSLSFNNVPETSSKDNATRASTNGNTGAKSFIPTGLRMPSPKIGYFDSEKSQVNNSTKTPHSDLRRSSMLKGATNNNNIGANKTKSLKIPSLKPAPKPTLVNSDSPYNRPSPVYKEDAHIKNELISSMPDEVQTTLDKVQKENGLYSSTSDDLQKENLFPLCDANGLNHDSMLEKMTALSISTKNDNVTDI